VNYDEWLKEFEKGKRFLGQVDLTATDALHSVRRYMCDEEMIWETGITYTGRVVIREGAIGSDGVAIQWSPWKTQHDIVVPK